MTTSQTPPATRVDATEPRMPLNLFVAYDDLESGCRAMELVQRLGGAASDGIDLMPVFWRVDVLSHDPSRASSATDAMQADIFVLGLSRGESFSQLASWLDQALSPRRGGSTAIVAAIPDGFDREPTGKGCLSALARTASRFGATFFVTGQRQSHLWLADAAASRPENG